MFVKLFGATPDEQKIGLAGFVIVFSLLIVGVVIVVAPIFGDSTSETRISTEVVKVMVGLIGTAFGYLVGSMTSKKKEDKDGD